MNFFLLCIPVLIISAVLFSERLTYRTHETGLILITGASTGIGRHAAEHLASKHKFTVLAGVRKDSDAADIVKMNIPNLKPILIDVANHDSCVSAVDTIKAMMTESGLPFVALVNNAGVSSKMP